MLLVPRTQDADLVVLMLVEVEPVQMAILKLKKVVIETLFADANFLGSLLETIAIIIVKLTPPLNLLDDLADFPLFRATAAPARAIIVGASHERPELLESCSLPNLERDRWDVSYLVWLNVVHHLVLAGHEPISDDLIQAHLLVVVKCICVALFRRVKGLLAFLAIHLRDTAEEHKALVLFIPVGDELAGEALLRVIIDLVQNLL